MRTRILLIAALALAGCAPYQNIGIQSDPPGAQIYLDGKLAGVTPLDLRVPRDAAHTVYLKREGYRPELVVLYKHDAADGIDFLTPADVSRRLSPGPSDDPELEHRLKIEVSE